MSKLNMSMRIALGAVAVAASIGGGVVTASSTSADAASVTPGNRAVGGQPSVPFWVNRPCQYEDSVNCRWLADQVGNHHGHSFIVRLVPGPRGHRLVCVFYTQRQFAKHNDYCS